MDHLPTACYALLSGGVHERVDQATCCACICVMEQLHVASTLCLYKHSCMSGYVLNGVKQRQSMIEPRRTCTVLNKVQELSVVVGSSGSCAVCDECQWTVLMSVLFAGC